MMSLPVWLPAPMFLLAVSVSGPMFLLWVSVQESLSRWSLSRGSLSRNLCPGVSVHECLCPGVSLSRGVCPRVSLLKGVSVQGVSVQRSLFPEEGVSIQGDSVRGLCQGYGEEWPVCILLECFFCYNVYPPNIFPCKVLLCYWNYS